MYGVYSVLVSLVLSPLLVSLVTSLEHHEDLQQLARVDNYSAVLEYIERLQQNKNCSSPINSPHFDSKLEAESYASFSHAEDAAIRAANTLNNMFKKWDTEPHTLYNDVFYYSMARALVESEDSSTELTPTSATPVNSAGGADKVPLTSPPPPPIPHGAIYGAAVAFDIGQYREEKTSMFAPYVHRLKSSRLTVKNIGALSKGRYAESGAAGFDWFWKQRKDYSTTLWSHREVCKKVSGRSTDAEQYTNMSTALTVAAQGLWTTPYYDCIGGQAWMVTYSVPFFGCTRGDQLHFKGVVAVDISLEDIDINQCADDGSLLANTHRCKDESTQCVHVSGRGFHRGAYRCECRPGYYFPSSLAAPGSSHNNYFNGSDVERAYLQKILNNSDVYSSSFECVRCAVGCVECRDSSSCFTNIDMLLREIPLGIQSLFMTISIVLAAIIIRLRKTKVMKASFWVMLEIIIFGALLLYATVVIQYFEPSELTCMLVPWFREIGFAIVYGALILKIYRVLAEFQSRKAHRVHVRDKDLLKYLLVVVLIVVGYMAAWTAINMDHIREAGDGLPIGGAHSMVEEGNGPAVATGRQYLLCKSRWWDYVIEIGEFLFLCFGIYLSYCIRTAPSDYLESRYVSWAIYNETIISGLLHIIRHFLWLEISPDYIFLMYFIRCQMTVTVNLILVLGPKLWYAHRPPEDEHYRARAYSSSDVHDSILPESMKLHVAVNSNGDVDVGEINLSEMDPEDIRSELKRLYTQLQIFKTKTMRKDNPHISKRRGGRKQTHRRFSLQAFHHKHRHHHRHGAGGSGGGPGGAETSIADHEHEMSRTPEESTNSAEGIGYSIEDSVCSVSEGRTPTVTFKPGHQSNIY